MQATILHDDRAGMMRGGFQGLSEGEAYRDRLKHRVAAGID